MTYNVRYFGHVAPMRGAASRRIAIDGITDAIAKLDTLPDVICLQEVETRSLRSTLSHTPSHMGETQIEAFMKRFDWALHHADRYHRYRPHYFPAHTYRLGKAHIYTTGLAVLVRDDDRVIAAVGGHGEITHRRAGPSARWKQSRICAHVRVATSDGWDVDIFNTHLSLPAFFSKDFYRIPGRMGYGKNQSREIAALASFVEENKSSDRYLIVGDFNSLPGSPVYDQIQDVLHVRDPFPEVLGSSVDALRTAWPTAGFLRYRMRLDHIFAGPGLRWLDFEDTHPFGAPGPWDGLSDHVPIVGRFAAKR